MHTGIMLEFMQAFKNKFAFEFEYLHELQNQNYKHRNM